jgi:diguanylate cyclase (GGDEF)-like protein
VLNDVRQIYSSLSRIDEKLKSLPVLEKQTYYDIYTELQGHQYILYNIYRKGDLLQRKEAEKSLQINMLTRNKVAIILIISWFISSLIFLLFMIQYNKKLVLSDKLNTHLYELESTIAYRTHQLTESNKQLEALSIEDPLTSLYNRRYFDDVLNHEYSRAIRQKRNLSLLMCDIDFFKLYNDSFGHQAGDLCLKTVADAIKMQCQRGSDIVVRYGGEEFAILLPDTNLKLATKTAEIIGNTIWQMKLAVSDENPFDRQTISIGVAELHEDVITSKSDLISHADRFLYDAKNKGRNTIVSSLGSTSFPSSNIVKFNPDSGN